MHSNNKVAFIQILTVEAASKSPENEGANELK